MRLEEAVLDFHFVDALPGPRYCLKETTTTGGRVFPR